MVQTFLQISKIAALAALTFVLIATGVSVRQLTPKIDYTLDNSNRAIREIAESAANLRHATESWKKASDDQSKYTTAAALAARKSFEDFDVMVKRTDAQLNGQILPQVGTVLSANSEQLVELEKVSQQTFGRIANDADALTFETTAAMRAATNNLNDPAIAATLKQLQIASEQTAATSTDIRQIADKVRNDYLKPQKFAWELIKQLAGLGGGIATMVK